MRLRPNSTASVRWLGLLCLSVVFFCKPVHAQGTYTAASCSQSDVNAVINGPTHTAVDGDTIIIPAGSCTWSSGITVNGKGIDITGSGTPNTGGGTFGAGTPSTTLTDHASAPFFTFTGLANGKTARVEMLTMSASGAGAGSIFAPLSFAGTCNSSGCANIRVDNINFASGTWGNAITGGSGSAGLILVDNVFGVIDHNTTSESGATMFLMQVNYSAWNGVGDYGDNSFASADTFGTGQAMYAENNSVSGVRVSEDDNGPIGGGQGGARYVCRFNHILSLPGDGLCGAHGTSWLGRLRGMRQVEVYYNSITGGCGDTLDGLLSGTGYYLSNTVGGACNAMLSLDIARFEMNTPPWNSCDGTQPWDQAPFSSSSACLDQPGRGPGALYLNATPVLASNPGIACTTAGQCWPNPALDPVYEAGEVTTNNAPGIEVYSSGAQTRILPNRDYYAQVSDVAQTSATSPFDGTSGTGYGTLARRPTTCTTGVGYWATDTGTWNTYNSSQEGTLYTCVSTNTWGVKYTPYTYPHPLETGGTTSGGQPPSPATSLADVVQ